jgi:enoyl-CoA hydratase/carnithine racemase
MREPSLGLVPDLGGTAPLVDLVGVGRALEICGTGRYVGADEALALGLVQEVAPAAELLAATDRLVVALSSGDIAAVTATAALLRGARGRTRAEQRAAERSAQLVRLHALAARLSGAPSSQG